MARKYVFIDEAGNFDFSDKGSRYFILTSVTLDACTIGDDLLELRRELVWEGVEIADAFHATTDSQQIRDTVFALLSKHELRVDATVFEKRKVLPRLQSESGMYELAWYLHLRHVAPHIATSEDEILVIGASITTRKKREAVGLAIAGVVRQTVRCRVARTGYWPAAIEPCLQVADYCCWAIQRKWERGDTGSHVLISDQIRSEFDYFRRSKTLYY